jgi:hypothetical protein
MLELVIIALAAIVISMLLVWIYRKLTASRGLNTSLVSLSNNNGHLRLSQQQGFVKLHGSPATGSSAKGSVKTGQAQQPARKNGGNVRKPWGW